MLIRYNLAYEIHFTEILKFQIKLDVIRLDKLKKLSVNQVILINLLKESSLYLAWKIFVIIILSNINIDLSIFNVMLLNWGKDSGLLNANIMNNK